MGIRLFTKDIAYIKRVIKKLPGKNISSWIREAISEKRERDEKKG